MMNDGGKKMTKKRVKYMVQSIAIMAVATFLSFFLQSYGIRKENILMIYIVGVQVINSYNYRLSVWNDGFCMQCAAV